MLAKKHREDKRAHQEFKRFYDKKISLNARKRERMKTASESPSTGNDKLASQGTQGAFSPLRTSHSTRVVRLDTRQRTGRPESAMSSAWGTAVMRDLTRPLSAASVPFGLGRASLSFDQEDSYRKSFGPNVVKSAHSQMLSKAMHLRREIEGVDSTD
eukprot:CAMPEP_0184305562 /NCGR_PEP_ID=MMETSP1049-20130417/14814_1 /TAXON_ID=77928 /ORGANISM="Proteomonas sulcata, Strain CCMP704" /LENGTH=156 /DNA_ID=CAMNT_0026617663 /DNA_START=6 /DNA_END=476 /DNA_ORIENTATION=+